MRFFQDILLAMFFFALVVAGGGLYEAVRAPNPQTISLGGMWRVQEVASGEIAAVDPGAGQLVRVPSASLRSEGRYTAFSRRLPLHTKPKRQDERIVLRFVGLSFAAKVYVNGQAVTALGPATMVAHADITEALQDGANRLVVIAHDWRSCVGRQEAGKGEAQAGNGLQEEFAVPNPLDPAVRGRIVAPVKVPFGIWDTVVLERTQGVSCERIQVLPDVREQTLGVRLDVETGIQAPFEMHLGVQGYPASRKVVSVHGSGQIDAELDAASLPLWTPTSPRLLTLTVDIPRFDLHKKVRFGFRQFATGGERFGEQATREQRRSVYLNGRKIHLFTASISPNRLTPQQLRERLTRLRGLNVNTVRFHGRAFPDFYYRICDEMGMLVIAESALYGSYVDQFDYQSDAFWANAAAHWRALTAKFANHPSIIAYSIANECVEYSRGPKTAQRFAALGRQVRRWDPSRPILFNGSSDPAGEADIESLHYPRELPFWNQMPWDAWFLETSEHRADRLGLRKSCLTEGGGPGTFIDSFWYRWPERCWQWGDKPLDLGEFGLMLGLKPHSESVMVGDAAYSSARARDKARARAWSRQIEAARYLDVAMQNPWNLPEGKLTNEAARKAFAPLKVVLRPFTPRVSGGETLTIRGKVANDTPRTLSQTRLELDWGTGKAPAQGVALGDPVWQGGAESIAPGGLVPFRLTVRAGAIQARQKQMLRLRWLDSNGTVLAEREIPVTLAPRPETMDVWQELPPVRCFDPRGRTISLLEKLGVPIVPDEELEQDDDGLVVVGVEAMSVMPAAQRSVLRQRIRQGRPTLVLRQKWYPPDFVGLRLNNRHDTTLGFGADASPSNGAIALQQWGEDGRISHRDFQRPPPGFVPLVRSGGTGGLIYAPVVRRGQAILSQLLLTRKTLHEPAAAQALAALLQRAATESSEDAAALTLPAAIRDSLAARGIKFAPGSEKKDSIQMVAAEDVSWSSFAALRQTARNGGSIWISGVGPQWEKPMRRVFPGFSLTPLEKTALPAAWNTNHFLAAGGNDQDWYWQGRRPVYSQRRGPLRLPSTWRLTAEKSTDRAWREVVSPGLVWARQWGMGWIVVDTIDWERAVRVGRSKFASSHPVVPKRIVDLGWFGEQASSAFVHLARGLGARTLPAPGMWLEAENMDVRTPEQPRIRNRHHQFWGLFRNSKLATAVPEPDWASKGGAVARVEVKARCRWPMQTPPRMEMRLDGQRVGLTPVAKARWRVYSFDVPWPPGQHTLSLHLVNNPDDAYNHRYLHVDWVRVLGK